MFGNEAISIRHACLLSRIQCVSQSFQCVMVMSIVCIGIGDEFSLG